MRVPLSWLQEYVELPGAETGRSLAERLARAGLEVEAVESLAAGLTGPIVVGEVRSIEELTGVKKPIRYCSVDVGAAAGSQGPQGRRGIICGATNFAVGDRVVVALPGAVLPGGFAISARRTYGHLSDGMICSARELGIGDDGTDAAGILVLPGTHPPGADALDVLGLRDEVLDIAVTSDRGYCLSLRGIARETATAYGVPFRDPAAVDVPVGERPGYPVVVDDPVGCDVFVALTVTGLDPAAPSPRTLQERVRKAGMRPISLPVDVTNLVMLELGQPLHAYDRSALQGPIRVRRARPGEQLETLDGVKRDLDPEDLLITDDSGPIGLAGVMGGASTEITARTRDVVIEAAHFHPVTVARTARRHRLPSEASRRFERGVDPALQLAAARRAAELLVEHGGGQIQADVTVVGAAQPPATLTVDAGLPARVVGYPYPADRVVELLEAVGCVVERYAPPGSAADGRLDVTPPTWRPDLTDPFDLVEEVARLHGYDAIPSVLPVAPPGRGLSVQQRRRRSLGRALAAAGFVETPCYPFTGPADWDALGVASDDPRRRAVRLANPLREEEPELRTSLLPGLLAALRRNVARGAGDAALCEIGLVFLPSPLGRPAPQLGVDRAPTAEELAALEAALPAQPQRVAAVLTGDRELPGWWGEGRRAGWADAIETAREVGRAIGVPLVVARGDLPPWHPGRCAELRLAVPTETDVRHPVSADAASAAGGAQRPGPVVGHAGELHPRAVAALGLPPRTCALELDLEAMLAIAAVADPHDRGPRAPRISAYPVATQDVALVVDAAVPAAEVEAALIDGAGPLLESVRLFDVYTGEPIPEGHKSLAFALRFRAPDRTLTVEEASTARAGAVAEASRRTHAVPRGG